MPECHGKMTIKLLAKLHSSTIIITMSDTQGRRIRKLREKQGLSLEDLGKAIGTTRQNIFKYESGDIANIPYDKLKKIAETLNTDPWYILGWEPPKKKEDSRNKDFISVPLISQKISAGYGETFLSDENITMKKITVPTSILHGVNDASTLVSAEVKGDSMIDANIYPGDYVFFSKGLIKGEGIYVIALAGDIMVKRLAFDALSRRLTIISENKNYPAKTVDADESGVRILGKVVGWIHNEII